MRKKLTDEEIRQKLEAMKGWQLSNNALEKTFTFRDFREAFAIMTRIAFEAEAMNHHPEWTNVYNRLTIRLSTHDAGGITARDFDLAERIESIVGGKNIA